ncbi:MFS general substrate transporter [Lichtheimia hyalospora FSU 10163]|nr:MFS general substrate transporter [Lichtheimia hyalospora FSU 10163]
MTDTNEEQALRHQQSQSYHTIVLPANDDDSSNDQDSHLINSSHDNHQHKAQLGNISLPVLILCANLAAWITSAYMLTCLSALPLVGKLSEAFGRKPVLVTTSLLFLIGSVGCGVSQTMLQMIFARAVAGFGGSGLVLLPSIVIMDHVPLERSSQYQSYINVSQTVTVILGPPFGGWITDMVGWRYCFQLNIIPVLAITYVYAFRLNNYNVSKENTCAWEKIRSIDFGGAFLLTFGILALAIVLMSGGNTHDWNDPFIITMLFGSLLTFIIFGIYERRQGDNGLLRLETASNRNVISTCITALGNCTSDSGILILLPQYLTVVHGSTISESGLYLTARSITTLAGCYMAGQYVKRSGHFRNFLMAMAVLYIVCAFILGKWVVEAIPHIAGVIPMCLTGTAFGAISVPLFTAVASDIPKPQIASATSMYVMTRYMGILLGMALSSTIVQGNLKILLREKINGDDADKVSSRIS